MILINSSTRQFNIPGADLVFGVTGDAGSAVKEFSCPRYVGNNLDLTGCFIRMNYRNANGEVDSYLVPEVAVDGDNVVFGWELSPKVTMYKGNVSFVMCVTGPDTKVAWHTTLGRGQVLEGLEPDSAMIEEGTADVVAALIAMVEAQTEAVENKGAEWVRNVQLEGTDQISAVQTAGKNAESDAVAQIEAKGASTLATIPGEYTATVNAVQSAANAIRGKVSGEVIRMDDVSPMEHYPVVKVHGKNHFFSNKDHNGTLSGISYSMGKNTSEVIFSGTANNENALQLPDSFSLPKGTYSVSVVGLNTGAGRLYLRNQTKGEVIINHVTASTPKQFTLTEDANIRTYIVFKDQSTYDNTVISIQIEKGETVTEYTPYIDPTTVTVRRCGKNLLPMATAQGSGNGITFAVNEDGSVNVNGTATKNAAYNFITDQVLPAGKYRLSGCPSGGSVNTYRMQANVTRNGETTSGAIDQGTGATLTVEEGDLITVYLVVLNGQTASNLRFYPMLRLYDTDDEYEPGNVTTHIPSSDGTVSGLSAVSPTMTLLTDTPGVNIECEYSRDTNKVIAEILEKITALGG